MARQPRQAERDSNLNDLLAQLESLKARVEAAEAEAAEAKASARLSPSEVLAERYPREFPKFPPVPEGKRERIIKHRKDTASGFSLIASLEALAAAAPVMAHLQRAGRSCLEIAEDLNRRGWFNQRGVREAAWNSQTIKNALKKIEELPWLAE